MSNQSLIILTGTLITLLSGVVQGTFGFGFGLISIPLLSLFLPAKDVVPAMLLHGTLLNIMVITECRKDVRIGRLWPLFVAGVLGVPLGTWLLRIIDPSHLRIFVGIFVILSAGLLATGFRAHIKREGLALWPIGIFSGILNGAITMSGPPVVLFLTNQRTPARHFRASLIAYFLLLNTFTVPAYIVGGLLTGEASLLSLKLMVGTVLGTLVGIFLSKRIKEKLFRYIALAIVGISGLLSLINGLGSSAQ